MARITHKVYDDTYYFDLKSGRLCDGIKVRKAMMIKISENSGLQRIFQDYIDGRGTRQGSALVKEIKRVVKTFC